MLKRVAYGMSFTYPCPRKLREIMKMSMIEKESPEKIEEIWKEYHSPRINNTCAVLTKEKYHAFVQR
jgi:ATP synthase F1 complex assembly factor 1